MTKETRHERPHAAEEIRQNVEDKISDALNRSTDHQGSRDITQAIVKGVDIDINETERALDRGPHTIDEEMG